MFLSTKIHGGHLSTDQVSHTGAAEDQQLISTEQTHLLLFSKGEFKKKKIILCLCYLKNIFFFNLNAPFRELE